ncbi:MAG TPA: adenylate/guanylate cyclase domain-containing protein, partial [Bdellovibrionota bacterium]|nr:adenylate/guanylate cyclase domain-containing protein [Bdellovibrionota bacterium]
SKQRGKVVLFGALLAFPLPAINHYVSLMGASVATLELFRGFLPVPIVIFPASIAFAIAKHNLFDVDVYIKRAVGYVIMTAVVGFGYFSIQAVTTKFVFQPLFGEYADEVFPIAFALLVVFGFDPINRKIQDTVDRVFFRQKFDYKDTVRTVSNALTSMLNLDQILKKVVDTVRNEMFIDAAGVFVLEPQKKAHRNYFVEDEPPGTIANGQREVRVAYDDPLLALIAREKKLITTYDIQEDPIYSDLKESCGRSFVEMNASMALPLVYQGEVTGVLALGRKKSGHFYSREDIDLLDTMADQAAVAVENAKLAEQMKKEEGVRANLSRYLSPQIVDQIVKHNVEVNLGGDKKVVTVLFSDIRNFTTITESRKPDELVHQLNEYFTEMAGIIFEHGGSLDKYIGDAIVAVFGSLIELDNSARHAAQAALKMMQRLPALNERWLQKYGLKMEFGIGLSTGEVFLGNIGSPERMEFTVIGDTVNVASRFSGLAKPGQILMTREVVDALGPDVTFNALPLAEVKGKSEKLEVFDLVSIHGTKA